MEKVVLGMSGGVDSSTSAQILINQGFNVIGVTLALCNDSLVNKEQRQATQTDIPVFERERGKRETVENNIQDARDTAKDMNLQHVVLDFKQAFQDKVIHEFISHYTSGKTPSPCVTCNKDVKFQELINYAKQIGANLVATGHYVRKIYNKNTKVNELHQGLFLHGDQSYFLAMLSQAQIDMLIFPLGEFKTKKETRELAKKLNIPTANKQSSQDICFTAKGGHAEFISKINPEYSKKGLIINTEGQVIGQHNGIIFYTVGQRRGLNIGHSEALYVIKIDTKTNTIIAGEEKFLYRKTFLLQDINWLHESKDINNYELEVKIRIGQQPVSAKLTKHNDKILVILSEHKKGIAPGQLCAFYEGSRVLGGGWIV